MSLNLEMLPGTFALCRMAPSASVPEWTADARVFCCVARTASELSIVADERAVPAGVEAMRGYRAMRVVGELPLDLVGVIASIAVPLAEARVPIFPIATVETDYILVHQSRMDEAVRVLAEAGHHFNAGR